jgi:hypothetical protein
MGKEAICRVRHGGMEWTGKAHLEEDQITVRGDHRVVAPLKREASTEGGWLRIPTALGNLEIELGDEAGKWAAAIQNPRTLIDKLGLKPGQQIAALHFTDVSWLGDLPHDATILGSNYDAILLLAETAQDLDEVVELLPNLAERGMLWIIFPKAVKVISDANVFAAGKAAGLVDIKTCRFDARLTGLKFVRPRT